MSLLNVKNLNVTFRSAESKVEAVKNLSFTLEKQEALALVGESGCGKSATSLAIMRLLPPQAQTTGDIWFNGQNLCELSERDMRKQRGKHLSMIFQEPMTSLNPLFTIGDQIAEVFRLHENLSHSASLKKTKEMLDLVRIPKPTERLRAYPHELSGGMRQRVMIAMALACRTDLLIADEPTTALDVTIQAQILELLRDLKKEIGMGILFITHDLGIVSEFCSRTMVMVSGSVVESGETQSILTNPQHPYTQALLRTIPRIGANPRRLAHIPPNTSWSTTCN